MKKLYLLKLFLTLSVAMMLSLFTYGQKKVAIVSGSPYPEKLSDVLMADSLASWGYDTTYMTSGTFNDLAAPEVKNFDVVYFGESIGSNSVPNFGPIRDNFPIPALTLEAACFGAQADNKWGLFTATGGITASAGIADDEKLVIADNTHYITEVFDQNEIVTWSTAPPTVMPYIQGLAYNTIVLAKPFASVTDPNLMQMCSIEDFALPNKIVWFGMTQTLIEGSIQGSDTIPYGTNDFYTLMHRSVDYLSGAYLPSGVKENEVKDLTELAVYPNPAVDNITVRFFSYTNSKATVSFVNTTGQVLETVELNAIPDYNKVYFDATRYSPGVYFVDLEVEGNTSHSKVLVK